MNSVRAPLTRRVKPGNPGGTQFILKWTGPPLADRITINSSEDVRGIWKDYVASLGHFDGSKEHMIVIGMNSRRHFLGWHLVAIGTATGVYVSMRELFRAVFAINAQSVILVHNPPSGEVSPSRPDEMFTRKVAAIFRSLELQFDDHVIIDSEGFDYYSIRGNYPDIFEDPTD